MVFEEEIQEILDKVTFGISNEERDSLNVSILLEEIHMEIKLLGKGKAPRVVGVPIEFHLWESIRDIFPTHLERRDSI